MEKSAYRKALGNFLTGVTIVTTLDEEGEPWGVTANAFTSVSLEPPVILVCLSKQGRVYPIISASKRFAVNILSAQQQSLAVHFAGPTENRFTNIPWTRREAGAPIFPASAAWLDCRVREGIDGGTHGIILGDVLAFERGDSAPLGYCRGEFVLTTPLLPEGIAHA